MSRSNKITHIRLDEGIYKLRYPIDLEIEFESDEYILHNNEFNLLTTSRDLKDGIERIGDELKLLWLDYSEEETRNLTEGGIIFRDKLHSLLNEEITVELAKKSSNPPRKSSNHPLR